MKALISYCSMTGNTEKVAKAIGKGLEKKYIVSIKKVSEVKKKDLDKVDLFGFGSGIYRMAPSKKIIKLIISIDNAKGKKAFYFYTSGLVSKTFDEKFKEVLKAKEFNIVSGFSCKGYDNWGPLKLVGGINKGSPNDEDLKNAEEFGSRL